jgi:hypothetical protein
VAVTVMMAAMTTIMARPTWTTAVKSRTTRTTTTTVGAASTAVWTTTASAITPATTEWALETRARIAADAGGVPREFFTRRACYAWRACFAGEKDGFFLDDGGCGDGFTGGSGDDFDFRVNMFFFDMFFLEMFRFFVFLGFVFFLSFFGVIQFSIVLYTERRSVFGAFVRRVCSEVGPACGATRFDFGGFFRAQAGSCFGMNFFGF